MGSSLSATGQHTGSTRGLELAEDGLHPLQHGGPVARRRSSASTPTSTDLLLLHIDETRLAAPVRFEQLGDTPEVFPHVYGPIPLDAVIEVERLRW